MRGSSSLSTRELRWGTTSGVTETKWAVLEYRAQLYASEVGDIDERVGEASGGPVEGQVVQEERGA